MNWKHVWFFKDDEGEKWLERKFSGCFRTLWPSQSTPIAFIALFYVLHWFFDTSRWTPFGMRSSHPEVQSEWYMILLWRCRETQEDWEVTNLLFLSVKYLPCFNNFPRHRFWKSFGIFCHEESSTKAFSRNLFAWLWLIKLHRHENFPAKFHDSFRNYSISKQVTSFKRHQSIKSIDRKICHHHTKNVILSHKLRSFDTKSSICLSCAIKWNILKLLQAVIKIWLIKLNYILEMLFFCDFNCFLIGRRERSSKANQFW